MSQLPPERTHAIAVMETRYAAHYGARNERFWGRLDTTLGLLGAFGGSAAFGAAIAGNANLGAVAGVVLAAASCVSLVTRPLERSIAFRDYRRKFGDLDARSPQLSLAELDKELKCLQHEAPNGLESLAALAWNDVVMSNGHPDRVKPLGAFVRLVAVMA